MDQDPSRKNFQIQGKNINTYLQTKYQERCLPCTAVLRRGKIEDGSGSNQPEALDPRAGQETVQEIAGHKMCQEKVSEGSDSRSDNILDSRPRDGLVSRPGDGAVAGQEMV